MPTSQNNTKAQSNAKEEAPKTITKTASAAKQGSAEAEEVEEKPNKWLLPLEANIVGGWAMINQL